MKAFVAVLLCAFAVVACAAPAPPPTPVGSPPPVAPPPQGPSLAPVPPSAPPIVPPSPAPSASAAFTVTCLGSPKPGAANASPTVLTDCSELATAVLAAVAHLPYSVQAMSLRTFPFGCGGPFTEGAVRCRSVPGPGPTTIPGSAYVTFAGTDFVAAVTYEAVDDPPLIAKLIAFEVPPAGWVMP